MLTCTHAFVYKSFAQSTSTYVNTDINLYFIYVVPILFVTISINKDTGNNITEQSDNETLQNLRIGDPLILNCTATAVRGISNSVNIIWTTGGIELRRVDNITAEIVNNAAIYTDTFEISLLSVFDNGREYRCAVMINATQLIYSSDQFEINFPGK